MQILQKNGVLKSLDIFNDWGKVGVSSIAWSEIFKNELFISTNDNIYRFHLNNHNYKALPLKNINDIHDINFIGDCLWISNTEFDEIIEYDAQNNRIEQRISLDEFRKRRDNGRAQRARDPMAIGLGVGTGQRRFPGSQRLIGYEHGDDSDHHE